MFLSIPEGVSKGTSSEIKHTSEGGEIELNVIQFCEVCLNICGFAIFRKAQFLF